MKKFAEEFIKFLKRDKKITAIICLGLAGIFLLTMSERSEEHTSELQSRI